MLLFKIFFLCISFFFSVFFIWSRIQAHPSIISIRWYNLCSREFTYREVGSSQSILKRVKDGHWNKDSAINFSLFIFSFNIHASEKTGNLIEYINYNITLYCSSLGYWKIADEVIGQNANFLIFGMNYIPIDSISLRMIKSFLKTIHQSFFRKILD
jgi:hypothetical protein